MTLDIPFRLRLASERAEMTQKIAARLAGLDKGSISSWETGERVDSMKAADLVKLLDAYGTHPSHFFSDDFFDVHDWRR